MTNDELFDNAALIAYHKATGCPVTVAKAALLAMEPVLRSRVLKAALSQPGQRCLHDPIEDDPAMYERICAAKQQAEIIGGPIGARGTCHRIWFEQERLLAAQGITWFSPVLMNPWMVFD